jgi:hypothetical protein
MPAPATSSSMASRSCCIDTCASPATSTSSSLEPANCRRAIDALRGVGHRPRLPIRLRQDWHDNRNMLVLQLWEPDNEERSVDVFVTEPFAFDEMEPQAVAKDIDGIPVRIASIRHLIRMKQVAAPPRP